MTTTDPIAPPPPPPAPPGPTPPVPPTAFNAGLMIVGLLISLPVGAILNIIAGLAGSSTNSKPLAFLIGVIPGLVFIGISQLVRRNKGLSTGLLIGGCIVALIGGACGAAITPLNIGR
jgi:hypothetical protein